MWVASQLTVVTQSAPLAVEAPAWVNAPGAWARHRWAEAPASVTIPDGPPMVREPCGHCRGALLPLPAGSCGAGRFQQFTNPKNPTIFNGLKTGHSAFFPNAVFAGPVDFSWADIGSNFEAIGAQFTNAVQMADFHAMKVGALAIFRFRKAIFAGAVDFASADIGRNFEADGTQFTNTEQTASRSNGGSAERSCNGIRSDGGGIYS
jgi:hypothetical protein